MVTWLLCMSVKKTQTFISNVLQTLDWFFHESSLVRFLVYNRGFVINVCSFWDMAKICNLWLHFHFLNSSTSAKRVYHKLLCAIVSKTMWHCRFLSAAFPCCLACSLLKSIVCSYYYHGVAQWLLGLHDTLLYAKNLCLLPADTKHTKTNPPWLTNQCIFFQSVIVSYWQIFL